MELWKKIDDYDNYSVSSMGNVRNDETMRILKGGKGVNGYLTVSLYKNSVKKSHMIHRLVAITFIPNPENKPYVDHRDNNKTDNRAEVLRWCTDSENQMNQQLRTDNTSGSKGVTWVESRQKWRSRIMIDGIPIFIGYFDTKEEAVNVRQTRANEAFGVFTNACESLQITTELDNL